MQIQSGKLYENKTWRYLYPSLKYYGEELMSKLASFFKLAVGVNDYNMKGTGNCIYILIDTNIAIASDSERLAYKKRFNQFLDWVSYKYYYVTDYIYDSNKHMVVLKLPVQHSTSYLSFIKGRYSEMYNSKELNTYFRYISISNKDIEERQNEKMRTTRNVLTKNIEYVPIFVDIVNKRFNTEVGVKDFKDAELDFPPTKSEEIFNYKEELKEAEIAS